MYSVGSLFYAIYFFASFPMFFRMDENPKVGGGANWGGRPASSKFTQRAVACGGTSATLQMQK